MTAANCDGAVTSAPTPVVVKADAPPAPTVTGGYTGDGVDFTYTVDAVAGAEYRMDEGPWQDSNVFPGITPLSEHAFDARVKQTATTDAATPGDDQSP